MIRPLTSAIQLLDSVKQKLIQILNNYVTLPGYNLITNNN